MEDDLKFNCKWKTISTLVCKLKTINSIIDRRQPQIYFANGIQFFYLNVGQPQFCCANGK